MRALAVTVGLLVLSVAARSGADDRRTGVADAQGPMALSLVQVGVDSHGEPRSAWVHRPAGPGPFPVIVAFHGGKGNNGKDDMAPRWRSMADRGILLVFPNGQLSDRQLGGWHLDEPGGMRHVDFVRDLLEIVHGSLGGDPDRTWATGMSGGAQMTLDLACKAPDAFQAFAPVAGLLLAERAAICDPPVVRPLQLFHGTADKRQPYEGRTTPSGDPHQLSAPATLAFFADRAGCDIHDRDVTVLPDTGDRTVVERWVVRGCDEPMEHFKIIGGGHSWPGSTDNSGQVTSHDVDATEEIVDFFSRVGG